MSNPSESNVRAAGAMRAARRLTCALTSPPLPRFAAYTAFRRRAIASLAHQYHASNGELRGADIGGESQRGQRTSGSASCAGDVGGRGGVAVAAAALLRRGDVHRFV